MFFPTIDFAAHAMATRRRGKIRKARGNVSKLDNVLHINGI